MNDNKLKGFEHLKKNIYDYIYEGMVKLGYDKGKSVSIFYQKGLLAWLLNTDENSIDSLIPDFKDYVKKYLGDIKIEKGSERYKVTVPYEGVLEIAESYKDHTFLKKLVDTLGKKDCTIYDIENVYSRGYDVLNEYEKNKNNIKYIHIRDYNKKTQEYVYFGEGTIPITKLLKSLNKDKYDGVISLETMLPKYNKNESKKDIFVNSYKSLINICNKEE